MSESTASLNKSKLHEIVSILQKGLSPGETYDAVFEVVTHVIPLESATLFLFDEAQKKLKVAHKLGPWIVDLASNVAFSLGKGMSSYICQQNKPVILQSLANSRVGKLEQFKSLLSLPLWIGDQLIGVLNIAHGQENIYRHEYIHDYELLARQISLVVDKMSLKIKLEEQNTRLKEALIQLEEAQDKLVEQERLAAIGQLVVTVNHEINNPLSTIVTNAEMLPHLVSSKNETSLQRVTDRIISAANKIARVTKKLAHLNTSRTSAYLDDVSMLDLTEDKR